MSDARIKNLADIMIDYSIRVKKGDTVSINSEPIAEPLVLALYEKLLKKGAFPVLNIHPGGAQELFFKHGRSHHFSTLTPYQRAAARNTDAVIHIASQTNTRNLSSVDPALQTRLARTIKPLVDIRRKKPWLIVMFPTKAYAQDAGMSLAELQDFVYAGTFADRKNPVAAWKKQSRKQAKLVAALKGADKIRIVGDGTDLTLSVKGRKFINSDGSEHNMPSGEVFAAPVENSADGHITYDFPVCQYGREIKGIRLEFRKGKVVEATAEQEQEFLRAMLAADPGASRLGEFAFGANMSIQRFIKKILFDEKIGGTVHLAVGSSINGSGGRNQSAIHWDMIKDLRKGGAVYVDDRLFMKDGKFR